MQWGVHGALAIVERSLEMAPMTAFGAFLITTLTTFKSSATERNFIVNLTTFSLLDLRLSLNCELRIRKF